MLSKALDGGSMIGRSVDMKITATGEIADAYDLYLHVGAYSSRSDDTGEVNHLDFTLFVRFIYWKTTHKKLLLGTVSVMDVPEQPFVWAEKPFGPIVEKIQLISTPVEIRDYWKKSFEKYVIVNIAKILKTEEGLEALDYIWRLNRAAATKNCCEESSGINKCLVYTCTVASWEQSKRNPCPQGDEQDDPTKKCWEGPNGFLRSDDADDFDISPCSLPVTDCIE